MGTGSHRAQFEGATGKRDRTAGIVHARALKSHSKLKFRQDLNQNLSHDKDVVKEAKLIASKSESETPTEETKPTESNPESGSKSGSKSGSDPESESESESESDESSLKRELQMLKSKEKLRAQLRQKKRPVSSWRSESTFSKK